MFWDLGLPLHAEQQCKTEDAAGANIYGKFKLIPEHYLKHIYSCSMSMLKINNVFSSFLKQRLNLSVLQVFLRSNPKCKLFYYGLGGLTMTLTHCSHNTLTPSLQAWTMAPYTSQSTSCYFQFLCLFFMF